MTQHDALIFGILVAANIVLFILPTTIIIRRMGFSGWWMLLILIPFAIFVGIWILALAEWPALRARST